MDNHGLNSQQPEPSPEGPANRVQVFLLIPLNKVRVWLMVSGVLLVLIYGLRLPTARKLVSEEIAEKHLEFTPAQVDKEVLYEQLRAAAAIALGGGFIAVGVMLKGFPVPITILCLLSYLVFQGALTLLKPAGVLSGIVLKLLIAIALVKAIHSAFVYQRATADTQIRSYTS